MSSVKRVGDFSKRFFMAVTTLPNDEIVFRKAAELRARFGLKTPDALRLSTAEHYGCTQLWTTDDLLAKVSALTVNVLET